MATEYVFNKFMEKVPNDKFYPLEYIKGGENSKITLELRNTAKKEVIKVFTGRDSNIWIQTVRIDEYGDLFIEYNDENDLPLENLVFVTPFTISEWQDGKKIQRSQISQNDDLLVIKTEYKKSSYWKKLDIRTIKMPKIALKTIT